MSYFFSRELCRAAIHETYLPEYRKKPSLNETNNLCNLELMFVNVVLSFSIGTGLADKIYI